MKVCELIKKLKKFPPTMEVVISDGYNGTSWAGNFQIEEFEGSVDIGVGGMIYEETESSK